MIKSNEIRTGNWVKDPNGRYGTVTEFYNKTVELKLQFSTVVIKSNKDFDGLDISPIELSPEILEAAGFVKKICSDGIHYENKDCWIYILHDNSFEIELNTGSDRFNLYRSWKYVHELQNLYYCICGSELEIEFNK